MSLLLMVVTAFICYLVQGELYQRFWKSGLTAVVSFQEEIAVCGESGHMTEVITNRKFLPLSVLRLKFKSDRALVFGEEEHAAVTDYAYRNDVFSVFPWQQIKRTIEFQCKKRGYYTIDQAELISHDLFFSSLMIDVHLQNTHLYVYPSEADINRITVPFQKLVGASISNRQLCRDPFEFQTIRKYGPDDSMRSVNWKATARTGELKVNVYEPTASQNVYLLLNLEAGYALRSEAEEEESIRICSTLLKELTGLGISAGIISNGRDCMTRAPLFLQPGAGPAHISQAFQALARIDTTLQTEAFHLFLQQRTESLLYEEGIYVMISSCQREETQAAFEVCAAASPGSLWIAPLCGREPLAVTSLKHAEVIRWEVPYDKV